MSEKDAKPTPDTKWENDAKQLTDKQLATRMKSTMTILKYGTLQSPEFWVKHSTFDEFAEFQKAINEVGANLKQAAIDAKLKELEALGVKAKI